VSVKTAPVPKVRRTTESAKDPALKISETSIKNLAEVFKVLADKSRLKILLTLAKDGEMHVDALRALLGTSQPAVSHHLCRLLSRGLVDRRRDGKHNFYRVESDQVKTLLDQFFADSGNGAKQLQFPNFLLSYRSK
jgi:ArsR family transcriptional regulator